MSSNNTYTTMPGFLPGAGYQTSSRPQTAAHPRLAYFITRNNGLPVPLIPADELPFNVKLQNVARVLSPQDTYGLQYVGCAPYSGATFQLERDATTAMQRSNSQPPNDTMHTRTQSATSVKQYLAADTIARQAFSHNAGVNSTVLPKRPISAADTSRSWRRSDPVTPPPVSASTGAETPTTDPTQAVIDAILRSEAGAETAERLNYRPKDTTPPPSGRIPDQEKKEYCTYWILHGDCAYVQQGCRYKHEMPDKAKLSEIGINHVPRWWLEKNAAVKFGEKAIVGGVKRPVSEWFKLRKDSTSDGDESESGSEDSPSEIGSEKKKPVVISKKSEKAPVAGSKQILSKPDRSKSPTVPPTRPSTPTPTTSTTKTRKSSVTNNDLIDFAPLLPTPSSSATSKSSATPTTKTTKVFVPAGESPEIHIADMKKRERVAKQSSRTPSPSKGPATGLAASKHAPAANENEKEASPRRQLKPTCRPRRAVVAKKVEKAEKN